MLGANDVSLKPFLQRLEKTYGKTLSPKKSFSATDFFVYLLLAREHATDLVDRSFSALKADFVDWNEVRVSSLREIGLSMRMKEPAARESAARVVRDALSQIFRKKNNLSLAFLRDGDFERGVKTLSSLDGIDFVTSVQVALHVEPPPGIQPLAHVLRVSRRLGLVEKRAGTVRAREVLGTLVSPGDVQRFHRLLLLLGEGVCQVKTTRCGDCAVNDLCPSSRVRNGAASRRETAARRKGARAKPRASGRPAPATPARPRARKK